MFVRALPAPTRIPFMWPFTGLVAASLQQDCKLFVLLVGLFSALRLPEVTVGGSVSQKILGNHSPLEVRAHLAPLHVGSRGSITQNVLAEVTEELSLTFSPKI